MEPWILNPGLLLLQGAIALKLKSRGSSYIHFSMQQACLITYSNFESIKHNQRKGETKHGKITQQGRSKELLQHF